MNTLACDTGGRNYNFVQIIAADGTCGYSEYNEGFGSPGITTVIEALRARLIGENCMDHERLFNLLLGPIRPAYTGVVAEGLGAIENALLDLKAKLLGVPCYELLGGKMRDRIRVYWSHCATYRITRPKFYPPVITSLDDVKAMGAEVRDKGFSALKTNMFTYDDDGIRGWSPGFSSPFAPELNVDRKVLDDLCRHLEALREGAGDDMDILLDLNFNAKTEGYLKILRALKDFDLFWVEIDTPSAPALAYIRDHSSHPISSCETLVGGPAFLPYLQSQAVDVAIVDAVWNGVWQSMKLANMADAYQVNVAPHNFYGHLATMMNAHFATAVPNFRIFETDIDRLPGDKEIFTREPNIVDGFLIVDDTPGWGTEPDLAAVAARPPFKGRGTIGQTRKSS